MTAQHLAAQERARQTHRNIRIPLRQRKILQPREIHLCAGLHLGIVRRVIDQDIEAPEALHNPCQQGLQFLLLGDIGGAAHCHSELIRQHHRFFGGALRLNVHQNRNTARRCNRPRVLFAKHSRAPGDHRYPPLQIKQSIISLMPSRFFLKADDS